MFADMHGLCKSKSTDDNFVDEIERQASFF